MLYLDGAFYGSVGHSISNTMLRFPSPPPLTALPSGPSILAITSVHSATPSPHYRAGQSQRHAAADTPTNLTAETFGDGSTDTQFRRTQSTDDSHAQSNIRYDVYVNGVWQERPLWLRRPEHHLRRLRRKPHRSHVDGYRQQHIRAGHRRGILLINTAFAQVTEL